MRREQPACIHRAGHVQVPWATCALVRLQLQCGDPRDPTAHAGGFVAHEVLLCPNLICIFQILVVFPAAPAP